MGETHVVNVDLADVWADPGRKKFVRSVAWGDAVEVTGRSGSRIEIRTTEFEERDDGNVVPVEREAFIVPGGAAKAEDVIRPIGENEVLKVNFVDVQQGDGAVIESPDGRIVLVDGGDNQMFARYLAGRFRGTTRERPRDIDCVLVTHGDSDHFLGLCEILNSETNPTERKRLFIRPRRYYHNGIVKRPSTRDGRTVPDSELFGPTLSSRGETYLVGLEDDIRHIPDGKMNQFFRRWRNALRVYDGRSDVEFRRLKSGDDKAFDFLGGNGLGVQVLGPFEETIDGRPALRFFRDPPEGRQAAEAPKGLSASHTINGNSVVFRLSYGGFNYLFAGDINREASRLLLERSRDGALRSEVLKVPHHGSGDFLPGLLEAIAPVVSVVSSGDESSRKEYIHPRATTMAALGRHSRGESPLVFVSELIAFMKAEGWSVPADEAEAAKRGRFYGFSRACYGIVKTRTDGRRLLVYTDSGNVRMKEAYAFSLDADGNPRADSVRRA